MPNIRISFHPSAATEVEAAVRWYAERSLAAARAFAAKVSSCVHRVEEAPDRRPHYLNDTRRYLFPHFPHFPHFPFSLVYRSRNEEIEVVAVVHHLRQPGYWRIQYSEESL